MDFKTIVTCLILVLTKKKKRKPAITQQNNMLFYLWCIYLFGFYYNYPHATHGSLSCESIFRYDLVIHLINNQQLYT